MSFASIVYLCEAELRVSERAERSDWTYLDSFWWSLMTITTVGQEDNPRSNLGKLSGGLCALVGVFLLTLPLPIVVNSFAGFYKNRLWRNEVRRSLFIPILRMSSYNLLVFRWQPRRETEQEVPRGKDRLPGHSPGVILILSRCPDRRASSSTGPGRSTR